LAAFYSTIETIASVINGALLRKHTYLCGEPPYHWFSPLSGDRGHRGGTSTTNSKEPAPAQFQTEPEQRPNRNTFNRPGPARPGPCARARATKQDPARVALKKKKSNYFFFISQNIFLSFSSEKAENVRARAGAFLSPAF
jgi:hypothetical protein